MQTKRWLKPVLIITGILSMTLGVVGIFVPILPTTPFLLLAAACFARSSDRLHHWLMNNRLLGSYIYHYRRYRAIPRLTKVLAIILLWLVIGASIVLFVETTWLKAALFLVAVGVTWHLLSLRTLDAAMRREIARQEAAE